MSVFDPRSEHDVACVPDAVAQQLIEGRPRREWRVLPNDDHWLQCERAQDVNQLLLLWFELGNLRDDHTQA